MILFNHHKLQGGWGKCGLKIAEGTHTHSLSLSLSTHLAVVSVIEPLNELDGGTLTATTGTHQSHSLPRNDLETQPLQNPHVRSSRIVEHHVAELNVAR